MSNPSSLVPLITGRSLFRLNPLQKPLQSWVESLQTIENQKLGIVDLHPSVFAVSPRLDILFRNVHWQNMYKKIVIENNFIVLNLFNLKLVYLGLPMGTN